MILEGIATSTSFTLFFHYCLFSIILFNLSSFPSHMQVCMCKYLRMSVCAHLHFHSNPLFLVCTRWSHFIFPRHTKQILSFLDYHGIDFQLIIDLCRKCFKELTDPFLNTVHSYSSSLQVPLSPYNLQSDSSHYLS